VGDRFIFAIRRATALSLRSRASGDLKNNDLGVRDST
jgi:hypothetical protein